MPERASQRRTPSASKYNVKTKDKELADIDSEQLYVSALDNPAQPDEASPQRGWIYFGVIVALAVALNLVVLVAISGGQ